MGYDINEKHLGNDANISKALGWQDLTDLALVKSSWAFDMGLVSEFIYDLTL